MDTSNNEGVSTNAGNSRENKQAINNFLVSAHSDVAENLRFTETKVGIAFALYGFIIYALIEARGSISNAFQIISARSSCCGYIFIIILLATFFCMLFSLYYLLKTITPRHYPRPDDTEGISEEQKQMWSVRLNRNRDALDITYRKYYSNLMAQDEDGLIKCETYELLKRSSIRAAKRACFDRAMQCFKPFVWLIAVVGIVTVIVNLLAR